MNSVQVGQPAWFCVRTQIKREHIAAAHLKRLGDVEVFLPRIRFQRGTPKGPVWVTEALFPNYLFARFIARTNLRNVYYCTGVTTIIHFGAQWPTIPDPVIEDLRQTFGQQAIRIISSEIKSGDGIQLAGGVFHGLNAVVTTVMPGKERARVLMDFLGHQTPVEIPVDAVIKPSDHPRRLI
jgi:transcriptional antiterminator RfaH